MLDQIFGVGARKMLLLSILAALPGAERREGAQPPRMNSTWLVETEILRSRRAIL